MARRDKHAHPAWYAAYVLDPINATYDTMEDKWSLPLLGITDEQRNAAVALVARVASVSSAAAQAEWDDLLLRGLPGTLASMLAGIVDGNGNGVNAGVDKRRGFWACVRSLKVDGKEKYPALATAAQRLLSAHATTCSAERVWSAFGRHYVPSRASLKAQTAEKLIFIKTNTSDAHPGIDYELFLRTIASQAEEETGNANAAT